MMKANAWMTWSKYYIINANVTYSRIHASSTDWWTTQGMVQPCFLEPKNERTKERQGDTSTRP